RAQEEGEQGLDHPGTLPLLARSLLRLELGLQLLLPAGDRFVITALFQGIRQVLLLGPPAELVRVLIALPRTDRAGRGRMRVPQMSRDRQGAGALHVLF